MLTPPGHRLLSCNQMRGATIIEYVLLAALIAMAALGALMLTKDSVSSGYSKVQSGVSDAI